MGTENFREKSWKRAWETFSVSEKLSLILILVMSTQKEKKEKKNTYFDLDWLTSDDFKDWVVRVKDDDTKYRCRVCCKSNKLSLGP